mgnify:CR=1 FL=1
MRKPIVVLGPQRPTPNLGRALDRLGARGPVALITAGWRHDEEDISPLVRDVARPTRHLPLYAWFEEVTHRHPDESARYRQRTRRVRAWKRGYRIRLHAAMAALVELDELALADPELYQSSLQAALAQIIALDAEVPATLLSLRATEPPWTRAPILGYRERVAEAFRTCDTVALAGGQVATLLNRLRFFGVGPLLREFWERGGNLVAWSAGAMVLTERVMLFYDHPPDGPGHPEVLDAGLGLIRDLTLFPAAAQRLDLDDARRRWRLLARLQGGRALGLANGDALQVDGALELLEGAVLDLAEGATQ